jgi:GR25 family glycosyltransferase involved in LPS biosynthesis
MHSKLCSFTGIVSEQKLEFGAPILAIRLLKKREARNLKMFYIGSGNVPPRVLLAVRSIWKNIESSGGRAVFISASDFLSGELHTNHFTQLVMGRDLLIGEVGCSMAHQAIYHDIVKQSTPWSMILEDDVKLAPNAITALETLASGLARLSGRPAVISIGWNWGGGSAKLLQGELIRERVSPTGTFAYMVNLEASRLLSQGGKIDFAADWPINAKNVEFYRTSSEIFMHPLGKSQIDQLEGMSREEVNEKRLRVIQRLSKIKNFSDLKVVFRLLVMRNLVFFFRKFSDKTPRLGVRGGKFRFD